MRVFLKEHNIPELNQTLKHLFPLINLDKIYSVIDMIPNQYEGVFVISDITKDFIKKGIEARYNSILKPAFEKLNIQTIWELS